MDNALVVASIFGDLLEKIGYQEIVRAIAVLVVGGLVVAVFAAGFIKQVAKNIHFGMIIGGVLLLSIATFIIAGIIGIFTFSGA